MDLDICLMRKLYWKIFLSFWLATILIILTTAWVTSEIAQKSSIPAHQQVFMDSYANAAIITYETGDVGALKQWLAQIGESKQMALFLLSSEGDIISNKSPPPVIINISRDLIRSRLDLGMLRRGNLVVSHEIISTSGRAYRLAALSNKPMSNFITIPWAGLTIRLTIAIFISGMICYLLSLYLTQPLRFLSLAARSLGKGQLNTRVGTLKGHYRDEIANLSQDFDRMAEQLETLVYSKERLLQDISHELRSPLARLQIAIELGRKKASHLAEQELNRMEVECLRLNGLIEEILQFARLDKSAETVIKEMTSINHLLQEIISDANYESQSSRVVFNSSSDFNLRIDPRLIYRAIENIVRNALHYSPKDGSIFITTQVNALQTRLILTIEDQGPGVPEEQLENIFNPFYRVDTSREKKTGGYGLGLAIAEKAVLLHHGKVYAANKPEGGLKVSVELPF